MIIKNNEGSIFIQGLISIAIFSVMTASIVRLLQMQNNLSTKTTEQFEMVYFVDEVRNILSDPKACKESFLDKNARRDKTATTITQLIEDENGDIYSFNIFEKGTTVKETKDWSLTLTDMYLQSDNSQVTIDAGTTFLYLKLSFKEKINKRVHIFSRKIKLFASIDNSENIKNCYTVRGLGLGKQLSKGDSNWLRTSDTKGHYLPSKKLLIQTDIKTSPINLKGPLLIGNTDSSCLKEIAGLIRYNKKIDSLEVCSGSSLSWRDLNSPPPLSTKAIPLRATFPIKKATSIRAFKYCSITYKNYDSGNCSISRLNNGKWEISHESSRSNFGTCEASCYN